MNYPYLILCFLCLCLSTVEAQEKGNQASDVTLENRDAVYSVRVEFRLADGSTKFVDFENLSGTSKVDVCGFIAGRDVDPEVQSKAMANLEDAGADFRKSKYGVSVSAANSHEPIDPAVFQQIRLIRSVGTVVFGRFNSTARHLDSLGKMNDVVNMSFVRFDDEMCSYMKNFPNVRFLDLGIAEISDVGLLKLQQNTKLEKLTIKGHPKAHAITKRGLDHFYKAVPRCIASFPPASYPK